MDPHSHFKVLDQKFTQCGPVEDHSWGNGAPIVLHALNRVTLESRLRSVHTYTYEASLAHESSLTTGASVADGTDYLS